MKIEEMINKIFLETQGNFEYLKQVPNNTIDLFLTDPPYGVIGNKCEWDLIDLENFTNLWWDLCKSKLQENYSCYIFWSQKYLKLGLDIFNPNRILIWHHPNLAHVTNKMFLWTYDPVFYIKGGIPIFNARFSLKENVDIFTYAKPQSNWKGLNQRFHPTSKPIKLLQNFIKISSKENSIILDPFMGGGSTALACKSLNRNFIGMEIYQEYIDISYKRLKEIKRGEGLIEK